MICPGLHSWKGVGFDPGVHRCGLLYSLHPEEGQGYNFSPAVSKALTSGCFLSSSSSPSPFPGPTPSLEHRHASLLTQLPTPQHLLIPGDASSLLHAPVPRELTPGQEAGMGRLFHLRSTRERLKQSLGTSVANPRPDFSAPPSRARMSAPGGPGPRTGPGTETLKRIR